MCMNCVTNVDAIAINVVAGSIFAVNAWERASDRRRGISRLERQQRTWLRNASFMRELGFEPIDILGPPPGHDLVPLPSTAEVVEDPVLA